MPYLQALEAAAWAGLLKAPRAVLAGDHLQLPPVVISEEAAAKGLGRTLFERLHAQYGARLARELWLMSCCLTRPLSCVSCGWCVIAIRLGREPVEAKIGRLHAHLKSHIRWALPGQWLQRAAACIMPLKTLGLKPIDAEIGQTACSPDFKTIALCIC